MEAEFFIMETLEELRPNIVLLATYNEAVEAVNEIAIEQSKMLGLPEQDDSKQEVEQHNMGSEDEEEFDARDEGNLAQTDGSPELAGAIDENDDAIVQIPDEEDAYKYDLELEKELDLEFEKELGKMMQEGIESRRHERRTFDASIPMKLSSKNTQDQIDQSQVAFTFLSKKGNRLYQKAVALPSDSSFAVNTLSKQQAEQQEKRLLKELVLNYEKASHENVLVQPGLQAVVQTEIPPTSRGRGYRRGQSRPRVAWSASYIRK